MQKLSIRDLDVSGKKVLLRVDFNVPMNKDGTIADDARIRATIPTIQYLLRHSNGLILMSHLGRPDGVANPKYTLAPVRKRLEELLKVPVHFSPEIIGPAVEKQAASLKKGEILLLENVRFHPAEEDPDKDPAFAKALAKLADVYVNDAFGTAHRAHSSTATIAAYFPQKSAAGLLMEKEIGALSTLLENPERPFYVVMGGAKISSKIGVIQNLLRRVDRLFLGGGMAYPFLKAKGLEVGDSLMEEGALEIAQDVLRSSQDKLWLPVDLVIADGFSETAQKKVIDVAEGIPKGWQGMDIGPKTIELWTKALAKAATVFWNGPLGVYEMAPFIHGTESIAKALAKTKAKVVVGGGDSAAAVAKLKLEDAFYHISMGGGATLEYLEHGHLPGIDCLTDV